MCASCCLTQLSLCTVKSLVALLPQQHQRQLVPLIDKKGVSGSIQLFCRHTHNLQARQCGTPLCPGMAVSSSSYTGRFECAVCQGVEDNADYCVLGCGHPFHVLCVETWLERSSTCPSCRAKVNRRSTRPLTGVETVPDVAEDAQAMLQRLAEKDAQVETLQSQLSQTEQQVENLQQTVTALSDRQERLQQKLSEARKKSSLLEATHLEDLQRLSSLGAEKQKLLEKYKLDMQRLQFQVEDEQIKQRQLKSDIKRLQLANPQLSIASIQHIAGLIELDQEGQPAQSALALAAVLATRNAELKAAQASVAQLQEQLGQAEQATSRELAEARIKFESEISRVEKERRRHLKDTLALEYENSKLKQDNKALEQQVQELRGVLLVLEGGNATFQGQCQGVTWQQLQHELQQGTVPPQEQKQRQQHSQQHGMQQQPSSGTSQLCSYHHSRLATCLPGCSTFLEVVAAADGASTATPDPGNSVPATQITPDSPVHRSSSQLLDELLGEGWGVQPGRDMQQQEGECSPGRAAGQGNQRGQQEQQRQRHKSAAGSCWDAGGGTPVSVDVAAALGPGSMLRPGQVLQQVPSFMGPRGQAQVQGGAVTGDFIRQGPDGRGSTATFVNGAKRVSNVIPSGNNKKKPRAAQAGFTKGRTGQTGIAAFFGRQIK